MLQNVLRLSVAPAVPLAMLVGRAHAPVPFFLDLKRSPLCCEPFWCLALRFGARSLGHARAPGAGSPHRLMIARGI